MASNNHINLLRTRVGARSELAAMGERLRRVAFWAAGTFLVIGIVLGATVAILRYQRQTLAATRARLQAQLAQEAAKEHLLRAIKNRLGIIDKALVNQPRWEVGLEVALTIATPAEITSWSVDEHQRLVMNIITGSLEEAVSIVLRVAQNAEEKKLKNPLLTSFQLSEDSTVSLALSFVPVFQRSL